MTEQERNERIARARKLIRFQAEEYKTDQEMHRPQPPLVKPAVSASQIPLPKDFRSLPLQGDLLDLLLLRRSHRVFTEGDIDLLTLSFLLWSMQGVKKIRGKGYATLRTVPSGGGRHAFETYLYVRHVAGLAPGLYHYLPMEHALELLSPLPEDPAPLEKRISESLCDQTWTLKASVLFFFSITPYRGEWRYGFDAHRVMMIDAGHVTENLYLAAAACSLGTCAIAAVDPALASPLFGLDGEEEYIFYAAPVGTIKDSNESAEQAFYAFLEKD